jgi:hypothetical protein
MLVEMRKRKQGELVTFRIRRPSGEIKNVSVRLSEVGDPSGFSKICETTIQVLQCQFKLSDGKSKYRVYALSGKGDGTAYDFTIENGPGGPPSNISVTPKSSTVEVTWGDPLRVSNIPKAQLRVRVIDSKTEQTLCAVALTDYRCSFPAVLPTYQLAIMVDSPRGMSERIELAEVTVQPTAPTKVTKARVAKVTGKPNYLVSWQAPRNNGGAPIIGYRVVAASGSTVCQVSSSVNRCSVKATQVRPGSRVQIIAVNEVGESQPTLVTVPR